MSPFSPTERDKLVAALAERARESRKQKQEQELQSLDEEIARERALLASYERLEAELVAEAGNLSLPGSPKKGKSIAAE